MKKSFLIVLIVLLTLLLFASCGKTDDESAPPMDYTRQETLEPTSTPTPLENETNVQESTLSQENDFNEATLGITIEQFVQAFNSVFSDLQISQENIERRELNYLIEISDNDTFWADIVLWAGSELSLDSLTSITVIGAESDAAFVYIATICAVLNIDSLEAAQMLGDLINEATENMNEEHRGVAKRIIEGVELQVSNMDLFGIWLTITALYEQTQTITGNDAQTQYVVYEIWDEHGDLGFIGSGEIAIGSNLRNYLTINLNATFNGNGRLESVSGVEPHEWYRWIFRVFGNDDGNFIKSFAFVDDVPLNNGTYITINRIFPEAEPFWIWEGLDYNEARELYFDEFPQYFGDIFSDVIEEPTPTPQDRILTISEAKERIRATLFISPLIIEHIGDYTWIERNDCYYFLVSAPITDDYTERIGRIAVHKRNGDVIFID
jgi:hypothetical protein